MLVIKNFLIGTFLIFLVSACSYYQKYNNCRKCIVNINESKDNVEKMLGMPIDAKKNKDGTFTVTYPFSYPIPDNTNNITANNKPLVYQDVDKIVILYNQNWKVKSFILQRK